MADIVKYFIWVYRRQKWRPGEVGKRFSLIYPLGGGNSDKKRIKVDEASDD